jgi:hypothetical protein
VDITRREDAFDLSGPFLPPQEPMPQRPVSTKYWKYSSPLWHDKVPGYWGGGGGGAY